MEAQSIRAQNHTGSALDLIGQAASHAERPAFKSLLHHLPAFVTLDEFLNSPVLVS